MQMDAKYLKFVFYLKKKDHCVRVTKVFGAVNKKIIERGK